MAARPRQPFDRCLTLQCEPCGYSFVICKGGELPTRCEVCGTIGMWRVLDAREQTDSDRRLLGQLHILAEPI